MSTRKLTIETQRYRTKRVRASLALALATLASVGVVAGRAHAFCGFYVSGADSSLYNDATMVVLMREGTRTVLSMQNNYQGPPEEFALVVPVPVVLQEDNVKTLPKEVFARVDKLAAPRLVEYWEQDPCSPPPPPEARFAMAAATGAVAEMAQAADEGVTVEAEFAVGEYDIVILSANDSGGLDRWLRRQNYNIPQGAEPVLRPYVEQGTKFFVAKVDPSRVTFQGNRAVLSPLRVHYDSETFSLPVRLGLLNSQGLQDLIVHVLARNQRYEIANYANATIPTNIRVQNAVRESFGPFYRALFERIRERNPKTVVTEYSWDASSCDPCPEPALDPSELTILGADVVGGDPYGFVLTRLHYRYGPNDLDHDLVFRAAPPIVGGRGMPNAEGKLQEQEAAQQAGINNFQGRYVILHRWEGELSCSSPSPGHWGGPPGGGSTPRPIAARGGPALAAPSAAPSAQLGALVAEDIESLELHVGDTNPEPQPQPQPMPITRPPPTPAAGEGGCAGCTVGSRSAVPAMWVMVGLMVGFGMRRLKRRR